MLDSFKTCWISLNKRAKIFFQELKSLEQLLTQCIRRKYNKKLSSGFDLLNSSFAAMEVSNQFKQVFNVIDANGDGKITSIELSEVLLCLGYDKSKAIEEAQGMVMEMDCNGDGVIDLNEFMDAVSTDGKFDDYDLMDAFLIFDADKNGLISAKELQRILNRLGCGKYCSLKECKSMIKGFDKDGDGCVDFEEFRSMMTAHAR
ncbi:EF_hand_5 domain-containing protein [Cephalotus follicularis]|uniref:EF_hand_5 domain-containing protein n=1 Tax=Cephalotus follicularis TaxID=3775 RepID=A0A1Q3C5Y6_CEPFO|nr:EF_hand_5 domain-containing protein [Cephalotus follicularis]